MGGVPENHQHIATYQRQLGRLNEFFGQGRGDAVPQRSFAQFYVAGVENGRFVVVAGVVIGIEGWPVR